MLKQFKTFPPPPPKKKKLFALKPRKALEMHSLAASRHKLIPNNLLGTNMISSANSFHMNGVFPKQTQLQPTTKAEESLFYPIQTRRKVLSNPLHFPWIYFDVFVPSFRKEGAN